MTMDTGRRIFLRAVGFGVGFAAFLGIAIAAWLFYQSLPPKPWNRDAMKATYVELSVNTGERLVVTFTYALENTARRDYYLPLDAKSAFVILPGGKGMSQDEELNWDKGKYVPRRSKGYCDLPTHVRL